MVLEWTNCVSYKKHPLLIKVISNYVESTKLPNHCFEPDPQKCGLMTRLLIGRHKFSAFAK
jgi:hypothetical protein